MQAQGAVEPFPVQHREQITIRLLNGQTGVPVPHVRLVLRAGYTEGDIERGFWYEETATDALGSASLPSRLRDFPVVQVLPLKARLCQSARRGEISLVSRVRTEGVSTPNHCGFISVPARPGTLVVFVRGGGESGGLRETAPPERHARLGTEARGDLHLRADQPALGSTGPAKNSEVATAAGLAVAGIAAILSRGLIEASAHWALLGGENEIDTLTRASGNSAGSDVGGTEEPGRSYDLMCQPED